ncbi:MAG: potassium/proton antiporter [Candidatus Egerieousia sp.]|nr:potassium/proton antiporter [Candidatus Egerieousia sp.]
MEVALIIIAVILFTCVFLNNLSERVGVPVLLMFILFGILVGTSAPEAINDYGELIGDICSISLVFVMFYGGFGTRWSSVRPVIGESALLASAGVVVTAASVALFCHYALGWQWAESLLMGSVISSTDAASVFSILRTKSLGLKRNTSPILEVESGSNDPCSYMLTAICLSLLGGELSAGGVLLMLLMQIAFGIIFGLVIAKIAQLILKGRSLNNQGVKMLFIFAVALTSYALPTLFGGNGYLSTYIVGIILGNTEFSERRPLVSFFDGITSLMEILIFFLLGFMSVPERLAEAFIPALIIFFFLTLVARPFAVFSVLLPFRKYPLNQMSLISFVGLRGAASIVFAIMTLNNALNLSNDIFSIVFVIVLLSISLQGSLIPFASRRLKMVELSGGDDSTFSTLQETEEISFGRIRIDAFSPWADCRISQLNIPQELLIVSIFRDGEPIVPNGNTLLKRDDELIIGIRGYENNTNAIIKSRIIRPGSRWVGSTIREFAAEKSYLVIMIKRNGESIIPNGNTVICGNDQLEYIIRNNTGDYE